MAKAAKRYHTLLTRDGDSAPWGIEFGAYDREDVEGEQEEIVYSERAKKRNTKIVTTGDQQADIDAAVAKLNAAVRS